MPCGIVAAKHAVVLPLGAGGPLVTYISASTKASPRVPTSGGGHILLPSKAEE